MTQQPQTAQTQAAVRARPVLRMIGNAHIDPVWLWRWPEGMQEVWATFRSALDRLTEYPEAVFTASSAAFYDWIERTDPEMFREIQDRVAEGRWAVVGGWWVEPDCNLPGGESFVRHGLYAQRFFRRAFGRTANVGYNPDSFGHNAMLPALLRGAGIESYVFMRPQPHEATLPGRVFWWEAPDGSRVLAARIVHEYCSPTDDLTAYIGATLDKLAGEDWHDLLCFYGVGNHGGGPTKANLEGIRRMAGEPEMPALDHARPEDYFKAVQSNGAAELPVHRGELQHHARGCYAAHSEIKRLNRSTEQLLMTAEKAAALGAWVADVPAAGGFEEAWRAVLFNQFHDILAGTSIESAYDDAGDGYGHARHIAQRNLHEGLARIGRRISISLQPDAWPLVVFNPHSWPVRVPVATEFRRIREGDVVVDEADQPVPFQLSQPEATVNGSRTRPLWLAELPAMGYRVYRVLTGEAAAAALPVPAPLVPAGDTWAETDLVRLDVDAENGLFSVLHKETGTELLSSGGRGVVCRDQSDTWSHGVERFDEVLGEFRPTAIRLVEQGPVRAVVRIESRFRASRLVQDVAVYRGLGTVHVSATLDWHERHALLKLRFPTPLLQPKATYEIPYGAIERPTDGAEEPGQSWIDLTGWLPGLGSAHETVGLSFASDSKSSFDVAGSTIGVTIARSPIYAHHEPKLPDPDSEYSFLDQGRQRFEYVLVPHSGDWRAAGTVRATAELLAPPVVVPETFHDGALPQRQSFVSVDSPSVVVSVVKPSEDDPSSLVVRAVETSGSAVRASIAMPSFGRWIDAPFGPFEIKTFLVPRDPSASIVETDLLERPVEPITPPEARA